MLFASLMTLGAAHAQTAQRPATEQNAGAATAEACAELFFTSMLDGDQKQNEEVSISPTQLDRTAQRVAVRFADAADKFRSRFVKEYGEEAWRKMNDDAHKPYPEGSPVGANGSVTVIERKLIAELARQAKKNTMESRSFVVIPNTPGKVELVRMGGRWFVKTDTMFDIPDPEQLRKLTNLLGVMSVSLERYVHAIGKPDVTPDKLDYQIGLDGMRVMGMPGMLNVPDVVSSDGLPKAKPFEPIGTLDNLPTMDVKTLNRFAKAGTDFLEKFLARDQKGYMEDLVPEMRPLVHPATVDALAKRVGQRWPKPEELYVSVEKIDVGNGIGCRIAGQLGEGDAAARFEVFGADGKWIGLTITADNFAIDTRELTGDTKVLAAEHSRLIRAVLNGDGVTVFRALYPDREPVGKEFDDFTNELPKGLRWLGDIPLCVRADVVEDNFVVKVFAGVTCEVAGKTKYQMCMTMYAPDKTKAWEFYRYAIGDMNENWPINHAPIVQAFIKALGSGEFARMAPTLFPSLREEAHKTVVEAFCARLREVYGEFQSFDPTQTSTTASLDSRKVVTVTTAKFSKAALAIKVTQQYGTIVSFKLLGEKSNEVAGFPQAIKAGKGSEMDALARIFLSGIMAGRVEEVVKFAHPQLLEDFGEPAKFNEKLAPFIAENGAVKEMKLVSSQYQQEGHQIILLYEVSCEKRVLDARVRFTLDAFKAQVLSINVTPQNSDEKEPEAKENAESPNNAL